MTKRARLSRYKNIESQLRQKRLDMLTQKKAMVQDIMTLAGDDKLAQLDEELCGLGDNLENVMMSLSPTTISKIHKRILNFEAQPEPVQPEAM